MDKETPCRSAGLRRCPRSTCVRRVASKLALAGSDIDATIPPAAGCLGAAEGEGRCRLGFAIAGGVAPPFRAHPDTIRRPAKAGSRLFDCCLVLRVPAVGGDWPVSPGGRPSFLWRQRKMDKETPLPQRRLAPVPALRRVRRVASNSPGGLTSTRQFLPAAGCASALQKGRPLPARLRHCRRLRRVASSGTPSGHDSSPRRRPGSRVLVFMFASMACFRLTVIGRVSPRDLLSCGDKERWIKNAPAAAPVLPVPRSPTPGGRVETRPHGPDIDATIPAGRGCARRCRRGRPLPARLRHCRQVVVPCRQFGRGISGTIRRPAQAGVQGFDPCCLVLGVPSVGGDWPGLAPAGDHLSCGDKERWLKAPCRSAGFAGASLRPRPAGRVETRPGGLRHRRDNSCRPRAALGAAEGESFCRLGFAIAGGVRAVVSGAASGHDSSPGAGRGQVFDLCCFGSWDACGRR